MKLAKDGKPYDIDNLNGGLREDEVEIIQFLRPDGRRRRMSTAVPQDIKTMAKDMILSAEELTTGEIALYARFADEEPEQERMRLATNGPGPKNPTAMLVEVIQKKAEERAGKIKKAKAI